MTYCLGILLPQGLVLACDSRSNTGVDQVARVRKFDLFTLSGNRVIAVLSAGNLATTQSVISELRGAAGSGRPNDLFAIHSMFEAARLVGDTLRATIARDGHSVQPYGDPNGSFLVGGQIAGEACRLFQIYSAGNFIEASPRSVFLQIGETKYGKPILDRALNPETSLDEAAKLALLSFDATMRSNLSVGMPIDILRYHTDSFSTANMAMLKEDDAYWISLRSTYSEGLAQLVHALPPPPDWRP
jgi:putative proteasome-type protease